MFFFLRKAVALINIKDMILNLGCFAQNVKILKHYHKHIKQN